MTHDEPFGLAGRHATLAAQRLAAAANHLSTAAPVKIATTPREAIWRSGPCTVWRYLSADRRYAVPILLVHSLISKPTIFDLSPGLSLVEHLLGEGHDVFLVDWGAPRRIDSNLRLEDYVDRLMPRAIDAVRAASGARDVTLLAYCLGGTLSLLHLARHSGAPVRNLVCLAVPVTFAELGLFTSWADPAVFNVDLVTATLGNVPPEMIFAVFRALKPASDIGKFYGLARNIHDPAYVDAFRAMDQWTSDHVPMAGATARQLVELFLREDRFARGTLSLGGADVDLARVRCPVLNCIGASDLIVPAAANRPLIDLIGSADKTDVTVAAGHMGLLAGRDAARKLWPTLDPWLAERSGS